MSDINEELVTQDSNEETEAQLDALTPNGQEEREGNHNTEIQQNPDLTYGEEDVQENNEETQPKINVPETHETRISEETLQRRQAPLTNGLNNEALNHNIIQQAPPPVANPPVPAQPDNGGFHVVTKVVVPKEARSQIKTFSCIGKFELILGIYSLLFGIVSAITSSTEYELLHIEVYGGLCGLGVLLIASGSCKLCGSPSTAYARRNMVFSVIGFLGSAGVAGYGIWQLIIGPKGDDLPYMTAVMAGVLIITAFILILHAICFGNGSKVPLQPVNAVIHINMRTGEKFIEYHPIEENDRENRETQRAESFSQHRREIPFPDPMQTPPPVYASNSAIQMTNITRSTSLRTVKNPYAEQRPPQPPSYATVSRHPVTAQQYRQQQQQQQVILQQQQQYRNVQYAQSEIGVSSAQSEKGLHYAKSEHSLTHVQLDKGPQYAQSEKEMPSTQVDRSALYAQPQKVALPPQSEKETTQLDSGPSYAQSERVPQYAYSGREMPSSQSERGVVYAHSEKGVPYLHPDREAMSSQSERGLPYTQSEKGAQLFQPQPAGPYVQSDRGVAYVQSERMVPSTLPERGMQYGRLGRDVPYVQTDGGVSYIQTHRNAPSSQPERNVQYAQSERGFHYPLSQRGVVYVRPGKNTPYAHSERAAPSAFADRGATYARSERGIAYGPAESEVSYAPSEYASSDTGRISPRLALAMRQQEIQRHQSFQSMTSRSMQRPQYVVATRPPY